MNHFQYNKKNKSLESSWCTFPNDKQKEIAEREEKSFINLLLQHKELVADAISYGISYRHFWYSDASDFYKIVAKYYDDYKSILTRDQFRNEVDRLFSDDEDRTYFRSKYDNLISICASTEDYKALRENIKTRNLLQKCYDATQKHFQKILDGGPNIKSEIESFVQDVSLIKSLSEDNFSKTIGLSEAIGEVWKQIEDRRDHPENYVGIRSGFKCLDKKFNGFLRGKYMVLSGLPNGGKTSTMFNMAMNMCISGSNVVYVTIESEYNRASQRVLCIYSGVDENRILRGGRGIDGLTDDTVAKLKTAKENLSKMDNFSWIQVTQGTPASTIIEMVERKRTFSNIDVVFIDYLDVVGKIKSFPNRPDLELADVSETFQVYGKMTDTLIITAQQLKNEIIRKLQKAKDSFTAFDAGVGDISGSQKIVNAADYVFIVLLDQKTKDRIYLRSAKARFNRALDTYTLSFDGNSGKLMDMPTGEGFEALSQELENDVIRDVEIEKVLANASVFNNNQEVVEASVGDFTPEAGDSGDSWLWGDKS